MSLLEYLIVAEQNRSIYPTLRLESIYRLIRCDINVVVLASRVVVLYNKSYVISKNFPFVTSPFIASS
jgi:hypothetical protein